MPPRVHAQAALRRAQEPVTPPPPLFPPGLYLVHARLYTWLIDNGYMYRQEEYGLMWRACDFTRGIQALPHDWDYAYGLYQLEPPTPTMGSRAYAGIRWITLNPDQRGRRDTYLSGFEGLFNGTAYNWAVINLIN